jgi:hypothetical protein
MSVQDDEPAGQDGGQHEHEKHRGEKPEPDPEAKQAAAQMMQAYEDRPTVVLPGSGGTVTGTAVNDWLDDDGDPKYRAASGLDDSGAGDGSDAEATTREKIDSDKARNVELREAAAQENKGEQA